MSIVDVRTRGTPMIKHQTDAHVQTNLKTENKERKNQNKSPYANDATHVLTMTHQTNDILNLIKLLLFAEGKDLINC